MMTTAMIATLQFRLFLFLVPVSPRQPKVEINSLWVQTSQQGRSDLGRCEAAFHSVADDVLTIRDENGTPTGKNCRLGPDDDERVIASRLKLESWRSGAEALAFRNEMMNSPGAGALI
jgi:hypothetical protein